MTRISASPVSATPDVPVTISVSGLAKDEPVTISAAGRASGLACDAARATHADGAGRLLLPDQFVLAWLSPAACRSSGSRPSTLTITAVAHRIRQAVVIRRAPVPANAVRTAAERPKQQGFFGQWLAPRDGRKQTAVVVLGGANPGLPWYVGRIGATLADHGYPVLEVAYFGEPGLPSAVANIPLEYFVRAIAWVRDRSHVRPRRVVTFGVSAGGELSLILASTFPHLINGAIAYVPSAWVTAGIPDAFDPAWTLRGRPYLTTGAAIPVERIAGPVFAVGGGSDFVWPSGSSVTAIAQRLRAHGRKDFVVRVYQHAGHGLGAATPLQNDRPIPGANSLGGSPVADELAREDAWPRLLAFMSKINQP